MLFKTGEKELCQGKKPLSAANRHLLVHLYAHSVFVCVLYIAGFRFVVRYCLHYQIEIKHTITIHGLNKNLHDLESCIRVKKFYIYP